MFTKDLDISEISKGLSYLLHNVTCYVCCQLYVEPATAACGHTLCQTCWLSETVCPTCYASKHKKLIRNSSVQKLTHRVRVLRQTFEDIFHVNIDEYLMEHSDIEKRTAFEKFEPQMSSQDIPASSTAIKSDNGKQTVLAEVYPAPSTKKDSNKKIKVPSKIISGPPPEQQGLDKIEIFCEAQNTNSKQKENTEQTEISPSFIDGIESTYTMENPRRSFRNKETRSNIILGNSSNDSSSNIHNVKSVNKNARAQNIKSDWSSVKKMKKEFRVLNKQKKNPLNVSIEMSKKAKNIKMADTEVLHAELPKKDPLFTEIIIDSPAQSKISKKRDTRSSSELLDNTNKKNTCCETISNLKSFSNVGCDSEAYKESKIISKNNEDNREEAMEEKIENKTPFFKKGTTNRSDETKNLNSCNERNSSIESTIEDDDIVISIKIGRSITNVVINKKDKNVELKKMVDQETQTSFDKTDDFQNNIEDIENIEECAINEKIDEPYTIDKLLVSSKSQQSRKKSTDSAKTISPVSRTIEILSHKQQDKRVRCSDDENCLPKSKKPKILLIGENCESLNCNVNRRQGLDCVKYIEENVAHTEEPVSQITNTQQSTKKPKNVTLTPNRDTGNNVNNICSENVFSSEKEIDDRILNQNDNNNKNGVETQKNIDCLLTPGICEDLESPLVEKIVNQDISPHLGTPVTVEDDSDKSVVEETPQKILVSSKRKNSSNNCEKSDTKKNRESSLEIIEDIAESELRAMVTPLTLNTFVNQVEHKSTPISKRSLNFDKGNFNDLDQTICPTASQLTKTTQEKELMEEAFEQTPKSPVRKQTSISNTRKSDEYKNVCVAGSCLEVRQIAKVKLLCDQNGWAFVNKYLDTLTHLVVSTDEDNKAQRTVKYMSALASGKWIVSFQWVEKCLQMKKHVNEESFEVLDFAGEPGPRRSRLATGTLFEGITFYCMPPFNILESETFEDMLRACGGRVVKELEDIRVTSSTSTECKLLLAEPEHTQANRFTYMALKLNIVPVNYEWALNCIGAYTIDSISELLLCPSSILPSAIATWRPTVMTQELD